MRNEQLPGSAGSSRTLASRVVRLVVVLIVVTVLALGLTTFVFHDSPADSGQWLIAPIVALGFGGIDLLTRSRRSRAKRSARKNESDVARPQDS
jgi:hypothetical protein